MNECVCGHMCHVIQYRAAKTDDIRTVGTSSAFDWLDVAEGAAKRKTTELVNFISPPQFFLKREEERRQAQIKRGSRQSCYF